MTWTMTAPAQYEDDLDAKLRAERVVVTPELRARLAELTAEERAIYAEQLGLRVAEEAPSLQPSPIVAHEYFAASARGAATFLGPQGRFQSSLGTVGRGAGKGAMVAAAVFGGVGLANFMAQPAYAADGAILYVPVAADLEGANNSVWQTDVDGRVIGGGAATVDVTAHPRNQVPSTSDPHGQVQVNGSFRWSAPLSMIGTTGAAWLEVQSDAPLQVDTVYVYNQSTDGARQGQALPVFAAEGIAASQRLAHDGDAVTFELPGPEEGKRANAVFFVPPESGNVRLDLYTVAADGTEFFDRNVWLQGGMYTQIDRVHEGAQDGDALRVKVFRNGHTENVFVYGALSVVDSVVDTSQDPVSKEGTIDRAIERASVSVAPDTVEQEGVAYARIDVETDNTLERVRVDWEGDGVYDTNTAVGVAGNYTTTLAVPTGTPGTFTPIVRAIVIGDDGLQKIVNSTGTSFTVTEAQPEARILGLDYDGDGIADNVDANGDGVLDDAIEVTCDTPYQQTLVSENATGDYTATNTPAGMAVSIDGIIDYTPSCDDANTTQSPVFARDGATMQVDYFVTPSQTQYDIDVYIHIMDNGQGFSQTTHPSADIIKRVWNVNTMDPMLGTREYVCDDQPDPVVNTLGEVIHNYNVALTPGQQQEFSGNVAAFAPFANDSDNDGSPCDPDEPDHQYVNLIRLTVTER